MTIHPFPSHRELVRFARSFLRDYVNSFRKDMAICLTEDANRSHAYFPALITCITFADFLGGLYAGEPETHGLPALKAYAQRFMGRSEYDTLRLEIFYEMFRHAIAHRTYPPVVFLTSRTRSKQRFVGQPQRRITWTVFAGKRKHPIQVIDYPKPQLLKGSIRPWDVSYDCRVFVSLRRLQTDTIKTIYGPFGYIRALEAEASLREKFAACMRVYYPVSRLGDDCSLSRGITPTVGP